MSEGPCSPYSMVTCSSSSRAARTTREPSWSLKWRVAQRSDLPGIDPRLVKAVGVRDGQHFILLDIDALVAPIIGS